MTHTFRDHDIDEIFTITDPPKNTLLHISYLGPTEETFYTRADILKLLDIIDERQREQDYCTTVNKDSEHKYFYSIEECK